MTTKNESTDFEQKIIEHGAIAAGALMGFVAQPLVGIHPPGFYAITSLMAVIPILLHWNGADRIVTALPTEVVFGFVLIAVLSVITIYQAAVLSIVLLIGISLIMSRYVVRKATVDDG